MFQIAAEKYRIPPLLDAEDFVGGKVDELALVLYVSFFCENFTAPRNTKHREFQSVRSSRRYCSKKKKILIS